MRRTEPATHPEANGGLVSQRKVRRSTDSDLAVDSRGLAECRDHTFTQDAKMSLHQNAIQQCLPGLLACVPSTLYATFLA